MRHIKTVVSTDRFTIIKLGQLAGYLLTYLTEKNKLQTVHLQSIADFTKYLNYNHIDKMYYDLDLGAEPLIDKKIIYIASDSLYRSFFYNAALEIGTQLWKEYIEKEQLVSKKQHMIFDNLYEVRIDFVARTVAFDADSSYRDYVAEVKFPLDRLKEKLDVDLLLSILMDKYPETSIEGITLFTQQGRGVNDELEYSPLIVKVKGILEDPPFAYDIFRDYNWKGNFKNFIKKQSVKYN